MVCYYLDCRPADGEIFMTDYSENYLRIQKLLRCYHNATLKNQYEKATLIANDLAEETIKLEFATYDQVRKQWLS